MAAGSTSPAPATAPFTVARLTCPALWPARFIFDGVNDFVQLGASALLVRSNDFTLQAWIFPQGVGVIAGKEGEYLLSRLGVGTIQYALANTSPGWKYIDTGVLVPTNEWTHVAWSYASGAIQVADERRSGVRLSAALETSAMLIPEKMTSGSGAGRLAANTSKD